MKPRHPRFGTRKGTKNTAAHIRHSVEAKAANRARSGKPAPKTRNRAGNPVGLLKRAFRMPEGGGGKRQTIRTDQAALVYGYNQAKLEHELHKLGVPKVAYHKAPHGNAGQLPQIDLMHTFLGFPPPVVKSKRGGRRKGSIFNAYRRH